MKYRPGAHSDLRKLSPVPVLQDKRPGCRARQVEKHPRSVANGLDLIHLCVTGGLYRLRGSKVNRTSKYQSLKIKTRTDNQSMQIATVLAIRVEAEESLATVRSSPRKGPHSRSHSKESLMSSSFHRPIHTEPCPLSRGRRTLRRVRAVHLSDGGCHVAIIKHEQLIF